MAQTLAQKLQLKPGRTALFLNAPVDYVAGLELEPTVIVLAEPGLADIIQLFVRDRAELELELGGAKALLLPNGMLWVTYYKGTATIKTDIHRDSIHAYAKTLGMEGVAMVAIDADWAALRLKLA
jgi:hypothetical protein